MPRFFTGVGYSAINATIYEIEHVYLLEKERKNSFN